ncbi:uncharacterized protein LOC133289632 [Gastrolobium bilobum]|uniref:uncharacterized protein LOC133289632 n=1 Tax=Gastrolobium bilobum TaxID=150636 RepID=UPI002AAF688D|nr:uncharacterized protein LOC133289632 [Gastrolobium bilobum]
MVCDVLEDCGMIDLGGMGLFFTWRGPKFLHLERVFKRLDRACANAEWMTSFPSASVRNLPRVHSDHCPILIRCDEASETNGTQPFRFIAAWQDHEEFQSILSNNWNRERQMHANLKQLSYSLTDWNKTSFGNITHRKNLTLSKLAKVQKKWTR